MVKLHRLFIIVCCAVFEKYFCFVFPYKGILFRQFQIESANYNNNHHEEQVVSDIEKVFISGDEKVVKSYAIEVLDPNMVSKLKTRDLSDLMYFCGKKKLIGKGRPSLLRVDDDLILLFVAAISDRTMTGKQVGRSMQLLHALTSSDSKPVKQLLDMLSLKIGSCGVLNMIPLSQCIFALKNVKDAPNLVIALTDKVNRVRKYSTPKR